jgi:diguanylate cyclase (GGDEF)-like protein
MLAKSCVDADFGSKSCQYSGADKAKSQKGVRSADRVNLARYVCLSDVDGQSSPRRARQTRYNQIDRLIPPMRNRVKRLIRILAKPLLIVVAAISVWKMVHTLVIARTPHIAISQLTEQVMLPVAILALVCVVAARHELNWARPSRRLRRLLPLIKSGERPIEELNTVGGPREFGAMIPAIQELLHDLRRQRVELAMMNEEMRQKVARRTDALERAIGQLRHQATRDALTGLGNRRMLDMSLPKLMETCRAQRTDLCVMVIDVDNFKKLNDTLGHGAGDQLLRDLGQLIRSSVRTTDMYFRLGGDEFVVLMPAADEQAASTLADRLVKLMDMYGKTLRVDPRPGLSIGITRMLANPDATPDSLLHAADKVLYEVKSQRKKATAPLARSA